MRVPTHGRQKADLEISSTIPPSFQKILYPQYRTRRAESLDQRLQAVVPRTETPADRRSLRGDCDIRLCPPCCWAARSASLPSRQPFRSWGTAAWLTARFGGAPWACGAGKSQFVWPGDRPCVGVAEGATITAAGVIGRRAQCSALCVCNQHEGQQRGRRACRLACNSWAI